MGLQSAVVQTSQTAFNISIIANIAFAGVAIVAIVLLIKYLKNKK